MSMPTRGWPIVPAPTGPDEVDPTGAGDVFAASFVIGLHQRGDPVWAADFACAAAAFAVESPGLSGIATMPRILERMAADDRV